MVESAKWRSVWAMIVALVWLTMNVSLAAIGLQEHQERQQFSERVREASETSSHYDIKPNPFNRPRRWSLQDANPFLLASIGIAGAVAFITAFVKLPANFSRDFAIALAWTGYPTACWLYSGWDGPSNFYTAAEISALLVAPIASGFLLWSWRIAVTTFSLPVISCGLMWAAFFLIAGNGR